MKTMLVVVVLTLVGCATTRVSSDPVFAGQQRQAAWVYETCVANSFGGQDELIGCREWSKTYCPKWYPNCGVDHARTETDTRWGMR